MTVTRMECIGWVWVRIVCLGYMWVLGNWM
jgi:hypothetical protein